MREKVFGVSKFLHGYIKDFSVSELIEKYRAYVNTPKTGEYWKSNDGQMIIVRYIKDDFVYYYYCSDGLSNFLPVRAFVKNFTKSERKSQYFELLIEEMKEVSK